MTEISKILNSAAEKDRWLARDLFNYGQNILDSVDLDSSVQERIQEFKDLGLLDEDGVFVLGLNEALNKHLRL